MLAEPNNQSKILKFALPIVVIASIITIFEFGYKVGQQFFALLH
jgi:hypothetical protein